MIRSSRLIFQPITLDDFEFFFSLDSDPEVMRFYRMGVAKDYQDSLERLKWYIDYGDRHPGIGCYLVRERATPIGLAVVIHLGKDESSHDFEIGYRLANEHWGKGFATEIAQALITYVKDEMKLSQVYGTTHPDNLNSQKVLLKTGFALAGSSDAHGGSAVFLLRL